MQVSGGLKAATLFAYHTLVGAVLFAVVVLIAASLAAFFTWLEQLGFIPGWLKVAVHYVEIGIFGLDLVLYALFLAVEALGLARQLLGHQGEKR